MVTIDSTKEGIKRAKLYARIIPQNSKIVGLLTRDYIEKGALIQFGNGNYAQINDGVIKPVKIDPE